MLIIAQIVIFFLIDMLIFCVNILGLWVAYYSFNYIFLFKISGLLFAPNVSHAKGFWSMDPVLSYHSAATEAAIQLILGIVSIILCIASVLLLVGSICVSTALQYTNNNFITNRRSELLKII